MVINGDLLSLTPDDMERHRCFLEHIHTGPGGGDALYLGPLLPGSIDRYCRYWLPLVTTYYKDPAHHTLALLPPLDVAWVWHLHRLAPVKYAAYCRTRFGRVVDPHASAFKLQHMDEDSQNPATSERMRATQVLWERAYPAESFFQSLFEGKVLKGPRDKESKQVTVHGSILERCKQVREQLCFDYAVETCSARQRTFLWQISQPAFNVARLRKGGLCKVEGQQSPQAQAIRRYSQFLHLMKIHGLRNNFFVPSCE